MSTTLLSIIQNLVEAVNALSSEAQYIDIESKTGVGDANYAIKATDRYINNGVAFSAPRTFTLPLSTTVNQGARLRMSINGLSSINTLTVATQGTDVIFTTNVQGNVTSLVSSTNNIFWEFIAQDGFWIFFNSANFGVGYQGQCPALPVSPSQIRFLRDDNFWGPAPFSKPQGRLTLQTGVPVPSSILGATTYYYTPYVGEYVPVFIPGSGTVFPWMVALGGDLSQTLSDTTNAPAATIADTVYDLFIWYKPNVGLTLARGPAWASNNVRSLALTTSAGLLVNASSITNGPGAGNGTYVGTIFTDSNNQLNWSYGGAASGGTSGFFLVWNMYNRVDVAGSSQDNGTSYTYASSTIRQARVSSANVHYFVCGQVEDGFLATYDVDATIPSGGTARADNGIGFNSITAALKRAFCENLSTTAALTGSNHVAAAAQPLLGFNFVAALEASGNGTSTITFNAFSENRLNFNWRA